MDSKDFEKGQQLAAPFNYKIKNYTIIKILLMKPLQTRVCVYPKDIQRITGKSERYGRKLLNIIKRFYSKSEYQFITIEEFCKYTGIPEDIVRAQIDWRKSALSEKLK